MSKWSGYFQYEHLSQPDWYGNRFLLGEGSTQNNLADEGEFNVLDTYLRATNTPSSFFLRIFNDTPVDTDSLASLAGEPGFSVGYAPQTVNRDATANGWPTLGFSGGNAQASSRQVTFDFTGTATVTYAVLATTSDNSGRHISYASLSSSKTLASSEQLRITYRPSLS